MGPDRWKSFPVVPQLRVQNAVGDEKWTAAGLSLSALPPSVVRPDPDFVVPCVADIHRLLPPGGR